MSTLLIYLKVNPLIAIPVGLGIDLFLMYHVMNTLAPISK